MSSSDDLKNHDEANTDALLEQVLADENSVAAKAWRAELLRESLPQYQPQEGSPPNTFTASEIEILREAHPELYIRPRHNHLHDGRHEGPVTIEKLDICGPWEAHSQNSDAQVTNASPQVDCLSPGTMEAVASKASTTLTWHGAPNFNHRSVVGPRAFRQSVREGLFTGPTNGVCPGFLQCNLVVLPQGQHAFDFLLFCQRNPKACPLIEVCDVGSPVPYGVAPEADLRTDLPKYAVYRDGLFVKEVTDAREDWPDQSVAFLIGCSFSYDGALMEAGIPLRSAEQGKNVPMFKTNLACRPAGQLRGNMVVSMKPIPALKVSKHVEITSKFPHAHGGPICIGRADCIGVADVSQPDWGEAVDFQPDEVPVFHACGVTPQSVLMQSGVPFAITHAAGHMFVTDLKSDMGDGF